MSEASYSHGLYGVKGKIASFEAHNDTVRTTDSPGRHSNTGVKSPLSATGTPPSGPRSGEEPIPEDDDALQKQSTTTLASQNRRNRLQRARQQQTETGSLMQRRLNAKERRMNPMQQRPSLQQQQEGQLKHHHQTQREHNGRGQRQQSAQRPDYSPCRNENRRRMTADEKQLTSPSSMSHTRSPTRPQAPSSGASPTKLSPSPNRRAVAVAQQHRTSQHAGNYNSQQQFQQQRHEIHAATNRSEEQDDRNDNRGGSVSRFHKLKTKGMDHAKLVQKRKEAAQKSQHQYKEQSQQEEEYSSRRPVEASAPILQTSQSSPHLQPTYRQSSPVPLHHPPAKSQESLEHANNDDNATLTSVARILDQEQTFSQSRDATSPQESLHLHAISSNAGKSPRLWMGAEEKSDKAFFENSLHHGQGIYPRPSSSSEYEPEIHPKTSQNPYSMRGGTESQTPSPQHQYQMGYHQQQHPPPPSNYHASQSFHHQYVSSQSGVGIMSPQDHCRNGDRMPRSQGSYPSTNNGQQFYQTSSARLEDDDRTFDYGVKDDDSQGSTKFQQQLLDVDRKAREESHLSDRTPDDLSASDPGSRTRGRGRRRKGYTTPKKQSDDGYYHNTMESPVMKTAAGVTVAATLGCLVVGPVGMLLGAAAVGIGVGIMQIPEEQRNNMAEKAKETMSKVEEQAYSASEALSTSCASTYKESGIAEHIPAEMSKFCAVSEDDLDGSHVLSPDIKSEDSEAARLEQVTGACGGGVGGTELPRLKNQDTRKPISPNQSRSLRSKKVACLRHVRIIPVSQIHGLDPSAQPRAWLDVLAGADTSYDEKLEAMEEILILAKDKQRARVFLEEGILDSIIWILSRHFEKLDRKPTDQWANPDISTDERNAAKLAATCCVTLGKAHCAAIHTEGDLLLMSLYERGTVPEERQLAQMLYEVPHHSRVTATDDPTVVNPSMEVFALKQLTLPQAEELARSIKALADGR